MADPTTTDAPPEDYSRKGTIYTVEGERDLPLLFPIKGIDRTQAFDHQPARTTVIGQNVRAFEPASSSARGGARPGLSQFVPATVAGAQVIQDINIVVSTSPAAILGTLTGLTWWINYNFVANGFTLNTRLVQQSFVRAAQVFNNQNILQALGSTPPIDFPNAAAGYQAVLFAFDQNGDSVSLNGQQFVTFPLRMNSSGGVMYLGSASQEYDWTQTYTVNPGNTAYTVVATLLDVNGNMVQAEDGSGFQLPDTFVQGSFQATTSVAPPQPYALPKNPPNKVTVKVQTLPTIGKKTLTVSTWTLWVQSVSVAGFGPIVAFTPNQLASLFVSGLDGGQFGLSATGYMGDGWSLTNPTYHIYRQTVGPSYKTTAVAYIFSASTQAGLFASIGAGGMGNYQATLTPNVGPPLFYGPDYLSGGPATGVLYQSQGWFPSASNHLQTPNYPEILALADNFAGELQAAIVAMTTMGGVTVPLTYLGTRDVILSPTG